MSNYKKYAVRLDESFKDAAGKYGEAWDKLQKAKKAKENAPKSWEKERYEGENAAKRARADADYKEAEAEFKQVQRSVWKEYSDTQERLTKELKNQLREDGLISVDALDEKGKALLDSGIMSSGDLRKMADDFSGNSTMLRLIGKRASEAAETAKTDSECNALMCLAREIRNGQSDIEKSWEGLCNAAEIYSGANSHDGGLTTAMNKHWNDANIRAAIDNF